MKTPSSTPATTETPRQSTHDAIARRARELWESQGRPAHRDEEIWLQAERELTAIPVSPAEAPVEAIVPAGAAFPRVENAAPAPDSTARKPRARTRAPRSQAAS